MMQHEKPTYDELAARLRETEQMISVLYGSQVDAIVGKDDVAMVRLKQAEKKLSESNQLINRQFEEIEIIYQTAPVGLCVLDCNLKVIRVNKRLVRIAGSMTGEMIGKPFELAMPQLAKETGGRLRDVVQSGNPQSNVEISGDLHRDGGVRHWLLQICPLHTCGEEKVGLHLVVEDITIRKNAEEELRQQNSLLEDRVRERTEQLETVNEALKRRADQLQKLALDLSEIEDRERQRIADLLHDDIQQMLVGAKIRLSGLHREQNDRFQANLAMIQEVISETIQKTRSLSRELNPPFLTHADLSSALRTLIEEKHAEQNLAIEADIEEGIDASLATKAFLYKAVKELLLNIVKHSGVLRAKISARRHNDLIEITVLDFGGGFEPERLDRDGARHGVGLLNIRERLESIGGELSVKSSTGQGSAFTLIAPDRLEQKKPNAEEPAMAAAGANAEHTHASGENNAPLRVLLVDDHSAMRKGIASLLAEHGIQIVGEAENGKKAIDLIDELHPDLVIMDISMPIMNGIEATGIIKRTRPDVRVIGLSMFNDADARRRMLEAGADDYFTKSDPVDELVMKIRGGKIESTT